MQGTIRVNSIVMGQQRVVTSSGGPREAFALSGKASNQTLTDFQRSTNRSQTTKLGACVMIVIAHHFRGDDAA